MSLEKRVNAIKKGVLITALGLSLFSCEWFFNHLKKFHYISCEVTGTGGVTSAERINYWEYGEDGERINEVDQFDVELPYSGGMSVRKDTFHNLGLSVTLTGVTSSGNLTLGIKKGDTIYSEATFNNASENHQYMTAAYIPAETSSE